MVYVSQKGHGFVTHFFKKECYVVVYKYGEFSVDLYIMGLDSIKVVLIDGWTEVSSTLVRRRFFESAKSFRKRTYKVVEKVIIKLKKNEALKAKIREHIDKIRENYELDTPTTPNPALISAAQAKAVGCSTGAMADILFNAPLTPRELRLQKLCDDRKMLEEAISEHECACGGEEETDAVAGSNSKLDYKEHVCACSGVGGKRKYKPRGRPAKKTSQHKREVGAYGVKE